MLDKILKCSKSNSRCPEERFDAFSQNIEFLQFFTSLRKILDSVEFFVSKPKQILLKQSCVVLIARKFVYVAL